MRIGPALVGLVLLVPSATLTGCRHRPPSTDPALANSVGLYRGRIERPDGKTRRFRLLMYAELPDRVHAEVISPLGTTHLILDGGGGSLAVTFVRDGVSYVGPASADALSRILGVRLTLEELVRGFLTGEVNRPSVRLLHTAGDGQPLPQRVEVSTGEASLELELKRLRPASMDRGSIGTGEPPAGTRVRPIEEMAFDDRRLEQVVPVEPES